MSSSRSHAGALLRISSYWHDGRLFANWSVLQENLEAGLTLLITQREMIVRELAYIDRERLRNGGICASRDAVPANPVDIA